MAPRQEITTLVLEFKCPHCRGDIKLSVDAYDPPEIYDDDDEWEDSEQDPLYDYYVSMEKMDIAINGRIYGDAVEAIHENLERLSESIGQETEPSSLHIPVLDRGGKILALMGDTSGLERMREIVTTSVALKSHAGAVDRHFRDMVMFQDIRAAIRDNPMCLQSKVKESISEPDGRRVANLISWLEKSGEIVRTREGRKIFVSLSQQGDV